MEVHLTPEIEAKLQRLATAQGRDAAQVVRDLVERHFSEDHVDDAEDRLQELLAGFEQQAPGPRKDLLREQARDELEAMLLEGLDLAEPVEVNARMWDDLRREAQVELNTRGRLKP